MIKLTYLIRNLLIQLSLPLGFSLSLLTYGLLKNKKKYLFSSLILIYFSSINIFAESLMKIVEYPQAYQKFIQGKAIVVLSGGIIKSNPIVNDQYEWNDPDRFFAGINLYKKDKSRKLIFTGGINPFQYNGETEGELLKNQSNIFIDDLNNIIVTKSVKNTFEESKQIKNLILNSKIPNDIILVTSAFHMKRAILIFEKKGIKVYPFPVDFKTDNISFHRKITNPLNWIPNSDSLNKTSLALKEIYGILIYKFF